MVIVAFFKTALVGFGSSCGIGSYMSHNKLASYLEGLKAQYSQYYY